ncbi:MAG: ATP phosphoribosyltransferase regulatory subunit [Gammaproteobacteria bacterium]|nr:ATP phosphoribosyltransferase regulatory subunit [Gammaproteobacteria bacterium]
MGSRTQRWLLPEGMDELVPPESARLERMRRSLLDLFARWGYEIVTPPFIEYLESLLTGTGEDLELHTFKLIDQLTGRMMGVRADMTPQVARIDARRLRRDGPSRLCYAGTVLHTLPEGISCGRSPIQIGAELYGHAGWESDCEIVCLMLEALALSGVGPVHLDMGHVGIFRALARRAGLPHEREIALHEALQRKAGAEVRELLDAWDVEAECADALIGLVDLDGDPSILERAGPVLTHGGAEVERGLADLAALVRAVRARRPDVELHVDLAELRGYRYHTGFVFAAFVPGYGREVARGGRYDEIGSVFGRARPATGFSADLKTLITLRTSGAGPADEDAVAAPWLDDPALHDVIRELRSHGERVIQCLPGEVASGTRHLKRRGGKWVVVADAGAGRGPPPGKTGGLE